MCQTKKKGIQSPRALGQTTGRMVLRRESLWWDSWWEGQECRLGQVEFGMLMDIQEEILSKHVVGSRSLKFSSGEKAGLEL